MHTIIKHIIDGTSFCAVEYTSEKDTNAIAILNTALKKGELEITSMYTVATIENAITVIKKKVKTHLILNDNQVLKKELPISEDPIDVIIKNAFPNIDFEDFYYEVSQGVDILFVSICRKMIVDAIVNQFEELDVIITSWSLGFLSVVETLPFMNEKEGEINTLRERLTVKNEMITSIATLNESSPKMYNVGGEDILGENLIAFGGVLRAYFNKDITGVSNFQEEINNRIKLFKQHRFFNKGLLIALVFLCIVFLCNFLLYNSYFSKVENLQEVALVNNSQRSLLKEKEIVVAQKEKRFDDVVLSASSTTSLYIDEMLRILPESIVLNSLEYQPITQKIKKNKEVKFEKNSIHITGITTIPEDISSWMSSIEKLTFVKQSMLQLTASKEINTFELVIKLSE